MGKLNKNGFMMAELIIVVTIILTTLVGLYSIFTKMYISYAERSYYYNVDAVYTLRTIYKELIVEESIVKLINESGSNGYIEFIDSSGCNGYIDSGLCSALIDAYDIEKVFLIKYENVYLDNFYNSIINNDDYSVSLKDYFRYLSKSVDFIEGYSYMLVIEIKDGDYRYYGNYRMV